MLLLLANMAGVSARQQPIRFENNKGWDNIMQQAREEKKLIFVDCYTSWCVPCKRMADSVFILDTVGSYFNRHFVNVSLEMEKNKDGIALANKYNVNVYPTMLFIDPNTGEIVHKLIGWRNGDKLLADAAAATDPQQNYQGYKQRYASGMRDTAFMRKYIDMLGADFEVKAKKSVAVNYLNSIPVELLLTRDNWILIKTYINDPLSHALQLVMANKEGFYNLSSKEEVDGKLKNVLKEAVVSQIRNATSTDTSLAKHSKAALAAYLRSVDFSYAATLLSLIYASDYQDKKDYRKSLDNMYETYKYNIMPKDDEILFMSMTVNTLMACPDKSVRNEAIHWLDSYGNGITDQARKNTLTQITSRLKGKS